jgi:hypothetical protein
LQLTRSGRKRTEWPVACMNEVQLRKNGAEVYMHMKGRNQP